MAAIDAGLVSDGSQVHCPELRVGDFRQMGFHRLQPQVGPHRDCGVSGPDLYQRHRVRGIRADDSHVE